jgi:hypothetical protein
VFRDAMLPVILKMTANSKQVNEVYRYHIDWAGPVTAPPVANRAAG